MSDLLSDLLSKCQYNCIDRYMRGSPFAKLNAPTPVTSFRTLSLTKRTRVRLNRFVFFVALFGRGIFEVHIPDIGISSDLLYIGKGGYVASVLHM